MDLQAPRTIEMTISKKLLLQFIEEKMGQFGFKHDEQILKIDLDGVPTLIPMKIKYQKERGVQITRRKYGTQLSKRNEVGR